MATTNTAPKLTLVGIILSSVFAAATCVCGIGWHNQIKKAQTAEQRCKALTDSLIYCQNEAVQKCIESNRQLQDWYQEQQQQTKREMEAIRNNKPSWLR
ncbi:hypothetical protein [Runella limosa]|uniref:hypothetical protein n=1 Tax=Runella limosa TaxID=370978 RepID=UPI000416F471|nr:hypothetical protein [Runella limosa]